MNTRNDGYEAEERFLKLIPDSALITNDQALGFVDRIERWGKDLVTKALSTSDRNGLRDAHLRIAATLDAVAQRTSGMAASRVRRLAEQWRLAGETLAESPASPRQEARSPRGSSETTGSRRVINQSGPGKISSRSVTPSQISSGP